MTDSTILFADIAGSTALYESIGDTRAEALVSKVLDALSDIVQQLNGQVIKTIGDEIMCHFPTSSEAVQAANRMHEYLANTSFPGLCQKVSIRVGAHAGNVIHTQGDIFGDTVNVAARVAALARGGKTMVSEQTYQALPETLQQLCRNKRANYLKGKEQPLNVYDVVWEQNDQLTRLAPVARMSSVGSTLMLSYNGQHRKLTEGTLRIGRGLECDLIVEAPQASRCHCEIRLNGNKFSLVDGSTNGTYILQNGVEMLFHNETVPLNQPGVLSLGQGSASNSEHLIHYTIESVKPGTD